MTELAAETSLHPIYRFALSGAGTGGRRSTPPPPLRGVSEPNGGMRLEFRDQTPETLLVGKAVRAVSGIRAALLLADAGYGAESAALLRMVSDSCTEITAVGEA